MYNMVAKNNQSKGLEDSTSLLDLINGPFRQYQYLDKDFGWPALKYTTITKTETGETVPNLMIPVAGGVDGEAKELNTAEDGQIFFVPFIARFNNLKTLFRVAPLSESKLSELKALAKKFDPKMAKWIDEHPEYC